jgi:hypothetical protein
MKKMCQKAEDAVEESTGEKEKEQRERKGK